MRAAMTRFRQDHARAGFIWLGFPGKEMPKAEEFVGAWPAEERASLMLLGNVEHDVFLTLVTRSAIFWRTPACDGVSASVLESLALGVPVVASDNGRRPAGVVTYRETDAADMSAKLAYAMGNLDRIKASLQPNEAEDKVAEKVDWLVGNSRPPLPAKPLTAS
jgi:glycosyltransferase involved in cell wall biosynthesis